MKTESVSVPLVKLSHLTFLLAREDFIHLSSCEKFETQTYNFMGSDKLQWQGSIILIVGSKCLMDLQFIIRVISQIAP
jgi:hypothetical protein